MFPFVSNIAALHPVVPISIPAIKMPGIMVLLKNLRAKTFQNKNPYKKFSVRKKHQLKIMIILTYIIKNIIFNNVNFVTISACFLLCCAKVKAIKKYQYLVYQATVN